MASCLTVGLATGAVVLSNIGIVVGFDCFIFLIETDFMFQIGTDLVFCLSCSCNPRSFYKS